MEDLSIHPGRKKYGNKYNPAVRADGDRITQPYKGNGGILGKRRASLETRRKAFAELKDNSGHTPPGSMKK